MKVLMLRSTIAVLAATMLSSVGVRAEDKPPNSQGTGSGQSTNAPTTYVYSTNSLRGFMGSLKEPIVLDQNPERRIAKRGRTSVDEVQVFALKDSGGTRFCISFYGAYGEAWLKAKKHALLVLRSTPIEQYGWGGYAPERGSDEEKQLATILATATGEDPKKYLELAPHD